MPESPRLTENDVVTFLRQRDYRFVRELGRGACGSTVLLHDDVIDESYVCKKYMPYFESQKEELFQGFLCEIKLLHKLLHENVVRVFNHYIYKNRHSGFILMEYIEGLDIEDYISKNPENTNNIFLQVISGFAYLESKSILHRDIRPQNIMVRSDGIVKIIDLGFGKQIQISEDFNKSISLNWWCNTPAEFSESRYNFTTEVYFIGKLFEKILIDNDISHFKYKSILARMCEYQEFSRVSSFADVEKEIRNDQFTDFEFSDIELSVYRRFADALCGAITKIEHGCKYNDDASRITHQLESAHHSFLLEDYVPDSAIVLRCFLNGGYYYKNSSRLLVSDVKDFLRLMKAATEEKRRIILANIRTRFDALPHYTKPNYNEDDIPF